MGRGGIQVDLKIPIIAQNLGALIAENNLYHLKLRIRRKLKCNPVRASESSGPWKRGSGRQDGRMKNLVSGAGSDPPRLAQSKPVDCVCLTVSAADPSAACIKAGIPESPCWGCWPRHTRQMEGWTGEGRGRKGLVGGEGR